jgi:H+-transporting ATPase
MSKEGSGSLIQMVQKGVKEVEEDEEKDVVIHMQNKDLKTPGKSPDEHDEEGPRGDVDFKVSHGLTSEEAAALLLEYGRNELEEKVTPKWLIFLKQLYQPMPIMIWIAAAVEGAIENWPDMGILLGIQFLNASLSYYETTKAGDAVAALKASLKPTATAKRDGKWQTLDSALLVPGDMVLLASGSAIPADSYVNEGTIDVDQSALTGESLPVTMYKGDVAKMGSTVAKGEVEGTVYKTGKNTFFGEAANMLTGPPELSNMQKVLIKIMTVLVVLSFILCGTAFGFLLGEHESVRNSLSFTVVLIVASIPIAIEIVCTTTLALGSRQLSLKGAIVSRLTSIEDLAGLNVLCSDKTGTLTLNKMRIQDETPIYIEGETRESILKYAAMAAKWREPPRDALDTMVLTTANLQELDEVTQLEYVPFDPTTKRTEGTVRLADGSVFKTTKGAPHIILKLEKDHAIVEAAERANQEFGQRGIRCLAVSKTDSEGVWHTAGLLTFLDPPRPDTKATIDTAVKYGIRVKMITGDHLLIARETARVLGMGLNISDPTQLPNLDEDGNPPKDLAARYGELIDASDGFAQVFPAHKYLVVETLRRMGYKCGMTGDGVNDAPALKRADVGIAVSGATDAARAAASIVLTREGLSTIVEGIVIARQIFQRMKNFINYRIAATMQLLVFFFIAVLTLPPKHYVPNPLPHGWLDSPDAHEWPRFFQMPVLMLMLITLLNDGTLISIGYDNVKASPYPEKWALPVLFIVSCVLGIVACASSLLLLWGALDSWNPHGWFAAFGIGGVAYGHITTIIYLKVSVSDFLTLFSARAHEGFFWESRPAPILMIAASIALSLSTALSIGWPSGTLDDIAVEGMGRHPSQILFLWVWFYCLVVWLIQDLSKVACYRVLLYYNAFGIRDTKSKVNLADMDSEETRALVASKPVHGAPPPPRH